MNSWRTTAGMAILGLSLIGMSQCSTNNTKKEISKMQEEVKSYNLPVKEYEALEQNISNKGGSLTNKALGWQKALDSLKMDAACKKAYMEGAQMVRDSIKTASKIKK